MTPVTYEEYRDTLIQMLREDPTSVSKLRLHNYLTLYTQLPHPDPVHPPLTITLPQPLFCLHSQTLAALTSIIVRHSTVDYNITYVEGPKQGSSVTTSLGLLLWLEPFTSVAEIGDIPVDITTS